jgi:hypothetical protein
MAREDIISGVTDADVSGGRKKEKKNLKYK